VAFFKNFYEIIVGTTKFGPQAKAASVAAYYRKSMPDAIANDTTLAILGSLTSRVTGQYAIFDIVLAMVSEDGTLLDEASTDTRGGVYDRVVVDISDAAWKITEHARSNHPFDE
jgi:hypothetical protein